MAEPLLLSKRGALESEYTFVCGRVVVDTPQLGSASRDLDQKQFDLTEVIKSERDMVVQLECL